MSFDPYLAHAFTIGIRFENAFTFHDIQGHLADYILGECGAEDSPLLKEQYNDVGRSDANVMLMSTDREYRITIGLDRVVIARSLAKPGTATSFDDKTEKESVHILPGICKMLGYPRIIFVGCVWEFVRTTDEPEGDLSHPIPRSIYDKYVKLSLDPKDRIIDTHVRVNFRNKVDEGLTGTKHEDFRSTILTIRRTTCEELYPNAKSGGMSAAELQRDFALLSVDVQRYLEPRRQLESGFLEEHIKWSRRHLKSRVGKILSLD